MKDVIVVPTYKERENIKTLIPMIYALLPDVHVVVADDNSPDGTGDAVLALKNTYPHVSLVSRTVKNGLGKAYINAFNHVLKDPDVRTVVMMDADLSLQPKYLPEMFEKSKQYSVVIGSRYVKGSRIEGWVLWRRILSFFGNFYCRMILPMPIRDYTCGYNVIHADLLRKVDFKTMDASGYAFILELKYLLYKAGAKFYEVPIVFIERAEGESKISSHIVHEGILAPWKMLLK